MKVRWHSKFDFTTRHDVAWCTELRSESR